MTEMDPRYQKRMEKDPLLIWLEPGEMKKANQNQYRATKKGLCGGFGFSDSTFKRYIHPNIEHVYDYTVKPACMRYNSDQIVEFVSKHVKLEQRVKFVCIENYIEDWDAYSKALDEIDSQVLSDMHAFAQAPKGVDGKLLSDRTNDFREWRRYAAKIEEGSSSVSFSPTREDPPSSWAVLKKYIDNSNIETQVRDAQREYVNDEARSLMDVVVDERHRTALPWVDITDADDEMLQVLKMNYTAWTTVGRMKHHDESDEQVYRRLFRGGARGTVPQAYIKVTLQMPDRNGKLGKQVYYAKDPLMARDKEQKPSNSLFSLMSTSYDAFIKSGLEL